MTGTVIYDAAITFGDVIYGLSAACLRAG